MRSWGITAFCLCAGLLAACDCESEEEPSAILLRLRATEPLEAGTSLSFRTRDLLTGESLLPQQWPLPDGIDSSRSAEYLLGVERPGEYRVHVWTTDVSPVVAAARCVLVQGRTTVEMVLGPIEDRDEDGWGEVDTDGDCPADLVVDCAPEDPDVHPDGVEQCRDGIDQDCDGQDASCGDEDGDGFEGCAADGVESECDCDDASADVNPGVAESSDPSEQLCENGRDEDCDGMDVACDRDGDGVRSCPANQIGGCDCDDEDENTYPGASETPGGECDGIDNDCNGLVDEVDACLGDDLDLDGVVAADACNDCRAAMRPGGEAVCGNRLDEDCTLGGTDDGLPLPEGADACDPDDADADGSLGEAAGGPDCDDADPQTYPGAPERCGDGVDQGCSGADEPCDDDADGDGWNASSDCDDDDEGVHPGAPDVCDGADQDCDGLVDEDIPPGSGCVLLDDFYMIDFGSDLQHCGGCRRNCNAGCPGNSCRADQCVDGACACGGASPCGNGSACIEGSCQPGP